MEDHLNLIFVLFKIVRKILRPDDIANLTLGEVAPFIIIAKRITHSDIRDAQLLKPPHNR